jgi:hypothetical protein
VCQQPRLQRRNVPQQPLLHPKQLAGSCQALSQLPWLHSQQARHAQTHRCCAVLADGEQLAQAGQALLQQQQQQQQQFTSLTQRK